MKLPGFGHSLTALQQYAVVTANYWCFTLWAGTLLQVGSLLMLVPVADS